MVTLPATVARKDTIDVSELRHIETGLRMRGVQLARTAHVGIFECVIVDL